MTTAPDWEALARLQAMGLLDAATARHCGADAAADPENLIAQLTDDPTRREELLERAHQARLAAARDWYRLGDAQALPAALQDLTPPPRGWRRWDLPPANLIDRIAEWRFVQRRDDLPGARQLVQAEVAGLAGRHAADLDQIDLLDHCLARLGDRLEPATRTALTELIEARAAAYDTPPPRAAQVPDLAAAGDLMALMAWPRPEAMRLVAEAEPDPPTARRLILLATMRFGERAKDWPGWRRWLLQQVDREGQAGELPPDRCAAILWLLAAATGAQDLQEELADSALALRPPLRADTVATRWALQLPDAEWRRLMGQPTAALHIDDPAPARPGASGSSPDSAAATAGDDTLADPAEPPAPVLRIDDEPDAASPAAASDQTLQPAGSPSGQTDAPTKPPPKPDWLDHLRQFVDEHWVLLAGALMILAGTSLLAFYTWDKHWLVRYTLLPGLLAGLTVGLARLGGWLTDRDTAFVGTATILRALAVGLLPAHALVPALIAGDTAVTAKGIAVPAALLLYGGGITVALRRWCGAVHRPFRGALAAACGAGIALVPVPLVAAWAGCPPDRLGLVIWAGASVALGCAAWAVHRFTRSLPSTPDLPLERLSWFAGGVLAACLLQGLAWSSALIREAPDPLRYGPLVIIAGWLVLLTERRANRRHADRSGELRPESFIGFATIGLGLALSMADPWWRIPAFAAAAWAWCDQARGRAEERHWWLAGLLLAATGWSLAAVPALPVVLRAPLGLLVSAILLLVASRRPDRPWAEPLRGIGVASLLLTAAVTVVLQWHSAHPPWSAAVTLLLTAIAAAWQACSSGRQRWALLAAGFAALALPYAGFVDLVHGDWYGNHLVAGFTLLAVAWATVGRLPGLAVLGQSRSLVGLLLGLLAIATLLIRVAFESGRPAEADAWHMALDYGGALGMAAVLALVAWWSRSLLPGLLAVVILVVLFPELKARFATTFDRLGWGTGLGSAVTALVLAAVALPLPILPALQNLTVGDRLLVDRPFPWRRFDHSLLTWPILAAAGFLLLRFTLWTVPIQIQRPGSGLLPWQTIIGLLASVPAWLAIAWFRGPLPRRQGRLQAWWRRLSALGLGTATILASAALLERLLPPRSASQILGWSLLSLALVAALLRLAPGWCNRGLAARLQRFAGLLAVAGGGLLLLLLGQGAPVDQLGVLLVACLGLALPRLARRGEPLLGSWICALAWCWLLARILRGEWATTWDAHWLRGIDPGRTALLVPALLAAQLPLLLREWWWRRDRRSRLLEGLAGPLAGSIQLIGGATVLLLAARLIDAISPATSLWAWSGLLVAIGLHAWQQRQWLIAGAGVLLLWLVGRREDLLAASDNLVRVDALLAPISLAQLAAMLALFPSLVDRLRQIWPALPARAAGLWCGPDRRALLIPALTLSALALVLQGTVPRFGDAPADLFGAYAILLAPLLLLLAGRLRFAAGLLALVVLTAANLQAVHLLCGDWLSSIGLQRLHDIVLGLAGTALLLSGIGQVLKAVRPAIRIANACLAALVLVGLAVNYLVHPDLSAITWPRLLVAAAVALVAGRAFRHLAHGALGDAGTWRRLGTAGYHLAIALAIACVALLLPPLRSPALALVALSLPVAYFFIRAERDATSPYRDSAAILASLLVLLTLFRSAFLLVFFPESDAVGRHDHYHHNAAMLCGLGLILLRCTGLGVDRLAALLGGVAVMGGSYFLLTALPGLSPFHAPVIGAWCAVGLAHGLTLVTHQRSPLRSGLMRLLDCDAENWVALRQQWGVLMLVATETAILVALLVDQAGRADHAVALLAAGASLLIHHGLLRQSRWLCWAGFWQVLLACHAEILWPTWDLELTRWALPLLWAGLLVGDRLLRRRPWPLLAEILIHPATIAPLAVLLIAHALLPRPDTLANLVLGGLALGLAAATPARASRQPLAWILPVGLLHLVVVGCLTAGWELTTGLPLVGAALVAVALGATARLLQAAEFGEPRPTAPLGLQLAWSLQRQAGVIAVLGHGLGLATVALALLIGGVLHRPTLPLTITGIATALLVAWLWFGEARRRERAWCVLLAQVGVILALVALRQQLRLLEAYRIEYDVWAGLLLALLSAGARQWWQERPAWMQLPLAWTAGLLPVATLGWIALHGLSTDLALIALIAHSLTFAWLGHGERQNPFQALAVFGFVGVALLVAWSKLELRVLHAYALPAGIGVLVLLQLFRDRVPPGLRNSIRGVALIGMLGSTAFHALLDGDHPLIFHACLLVTALGVLIAGGLLRLRIYLILGMAGVLVAVGSLTVLGLGQVDRGLRMSLIGGLVLLAGAGLVGGTIVLKARREAVIGALDRWRQRWRGWE